MPPNLMALDYKIVKKKKKNNNKKERNGKKRRFCFKERLKG